jgi:molybdopterin-guanine dinucleotide biosynthesis protein A
MPSVTRVKAGFVLAGGISSRMGRNKALLPWRGTTLLDYVAGEVRAAAGSLAIVGPTGQYEGFPEIADLFTGAGPLGGVITALRSSEAEWNLIVACDMPGINASVLREMLDGAQAAEPDCLLPVGPSGRPEPLCAVWHKRAEPILTRALETGVRKMTDAMEGLHVVRWPIANGEVFRNVNTPDDWADHLAQGKSA